MNSFSSAVSQESLTPSSNYSCSNEMGYNNKSRNSSFSDHFEGEIKKEKFESTRLLPLLPRISYNQINENISEKHSKRIATKATR